VALEQLHAAFWEGAAVENVAGAAGMDSSTLVERFREAGMPTVRPDEVAVHPEPPEALRRIYARYEAGTPLSELGDRFQIPPERLSELFEKFGLTSGRVSRRRTGQGRVPNHPRAEEMCSMYLAGATLDQIGEHFGLTKERIRQVLARTDASTAAFKELRRENLERRRQERIEEHRAAVRNAFEAHGDIAVAAEEVGLPRSLVAEIVRQDPAWARKHKRDGRAKKRYSEEELMECLRAASAAWTGILTGAKYEWFADGRKFEDGRPWPGRQTFMLRHGSWRSALSRAGLPSNPPSAVAGRRKFSRERCIGALRHAATVLGKVPTAAEYDRLARASEGRLPSQATVRNTLGTWNDALREAEL
jgi:hypothetical protein